MNRPTQPFILTGSINRDQPARLGWRRGGHLCRVADNTVWSHWQVTFRSSEVNFTKNYTLLYHVWDVICIGTSFLPLINVSVARTMCQCRSCPVYPLYVYTMSWSYSCRMYTVGRFQHATDAAYEKYRCPIFKGFVVCVSGMASDDRNSVRSVVEQNGQSSECLIFTQYICSLHASCCHFVRLTVYVVCLVFKRLTLL